MDDGCLYFLIFVKHSRKNGSMDLNEIQHKDRLQSSIVHRLHFILKNVDLPREEYSNNRGYRKLCNTNFIITMLLSTIFFRIILMHQKIAWKRLHNTYHTFFCTLCTIDAIIVKMVYLFNKDLSILEIASIHDIINYINPNHLINYSIK